MCKDTNNGCVCMGPQGPQGVPGMQGNQGIQGPTGLSGKDGLPGAVGPQGLQGPAGAIGPQGLTGAIGLQGLQGLTGAQGNVGSNGNTGPIGPVGPQGAQGSMGAQGNPGPVGPIGPIGNIGPQGIAGLPGANGLNGSAGQIGPQGPQGNIGVQGPQGIQGVAGKDCNCITGPYANVFASTAQTIAAYNAPAVKDQVLFDSQNAVSSATDFDLSQMNISGDIKFLKHGIYHLAWQLQARITPPVPNPVPSWSFGFWLNGALVPGSIYSGFTQAPGDDACHSTGDIIIEMKANDMLRLRNASVSQVNLNPSVTGSVFPITIASINIECLKLIP